MPEAGKNYGWPVITYGRDYSFLKIGEGTAKPGLEQPIYYWDPSIAPSGAAFYTGDRVPGMEGQPVRRRPCRPGAAPPGARRRARWCGEEKLLADLGERIRDVRNGPDGALWLLTDSPEGRVLRVVPGS